MMIGSDSLLASVIGSSDSLENAKLASTLDALQQGPRPLPLFLQLAQQETAGDAARLRNILAGLRKLQEAPAPPAPPPPPVIASAGRARLFDYGGTGPAAVFVPSLINPASILDLAETDSMLRWLSTQGCRPLLVDWGTPDASERGRDLGGHVTGLLQPMLRDIGAPYHLTGYCLGGTLALASAALAQPLSVVLIAAPWAFDGFPAPAVEALNDLWDQAQPMVNQLGLLPLELFQAGFWLLDPARTVSKYAQFAQMPQGSAQAERFVRIENWANSGAPLTQAAARELVDDLFTANAPGQGRWQVDGVPVAPSRLRCPVGQIVSLTDRIVPAATALDGTDRFDLALGHVGMIVGSQAKRAVWRRLATWLSQSCASW